MNTTKFAMKLAIPLFVALAYGPAQGLAAPLLGSSGDFAVLAYSTVTNTGPTTITGDLGLSPGTAITFGGLTLNGDVFTDSNPVALLAQTDATTAYNALANMTGATDFGPGLYDLGGDVLTPGVYKMGSAALTGTLTLNFLGNPDAAFVFQIGSTLITASGSNVLVQNGGTLSGIYWQVGSSATLATNSTFSGNIIALASDTLTTGASVCGRVWARNGAVTLDSNTITNDCGFDSHGYSSGLVLDTTGHAALVPEPETYAMLLAGLGMMGFVARRRQRNLAAAA
jgi:hypothetical protein